MSQFSSIQLEQLLDKVETYDQKRPASLPSKALISDADREYWKIIELIPSKNRRDMDALGKMLECLREERILGARIFVGKARDEFNQLMKMTKQYRKAQDTRSTVFGQSRQLPDTYEAHTTMKTQGHHGSHTSNQSDNRQRNVVRDTVPEQSIAHDGSGYGHHERNQDRGYNTTIVPGRNSQGNETDQVVRRLDGPDRQQMARQNSKRSSVAIRRNNPEIADLSDENRPTKIAERYSELYDNQWTDAFDALTNNEGYTERQAIDRLRDILEDAYIFTQKEAEALMRKVGSRLLKTIATGVYDAQNDQMPSIDTDADLSMENRYHVGQLRKERAPGVLPEMQKKFIKSEHYQSIRTPLKDPKTAKSLDIYTHLAVDVTWWMNVQDPSVVMDLSRDKSDAEDFDSAVYRAFMKSGNMVAFYVWPALFLYKPEEGRGPLMAKGVAQGCQTANSNTRL